jgi:hypothetical protein
MAARENRFISHSGINGEQKLDADRNDFIRRNHPGQECCTRSRTAPKANAAAWSLAARRLAEFLRDFLCAPHLEQMGLAPIEVPSSE